MNEIWKTIPGFERYEASDMGRVRIAVHAYKARFPVGHILTPSPNHKNKYLSVMLAKEANKYFRLNLQRIILTTFRGEPDPGMEAAHLDGDKSNNALSNLEWKSHSQNEMDKRRHGTAPIGERNGVAKLDERRVLRIRELIAEGISHYKIAPLFNVSQTAINHIALGKTWTHIR